MAQVLLVTTISLVMSSRFAYGTAAIVIRMPDQIVAAADSRSVDAYGVPETAVSCKIRRFGDAFVLVNGMVSDPPSGYDLFSILARAGKKRGILEERIVAFQLAVKSPLEKALNRIKEDDPAAFHRNAHDIAPLGVSFFGIEQGVLVLKDLRFGVKLLRSNAVSITIERTDCPGNECPGGFSFVAIGERELRERFAKDSAALLRGDVVETARNFIQTHIDIRVRNVGPPIDILRITPNMTEWIQHKPECPREIQ